MTVDSTTTAVQAVPVVAMEEAEVHREEGAVEMVRRSGKPIDTLIREVSSPGGTTLAALASFEKSGFVQSVAEAMRACTVRADEITAEL